MNALRSQMKTFYEKLSFRNQRERPATRRIRTEIWRRMDRFDKANPGLHPCLLKARLHEEIAERFEPVIFPASPFYFETGLRPAENWGTPGTDRHAGAWLYHTRRHLWSDTAAFLNMEFFFRTSITAGPSAFDSDHHCLNYTKLLRVGVNGIIREIEDRSTENISADQKAFLEAAARSCRAVLRVAERFAERAEALLQKSLPSAQGRFLETIAATARRIPAEPPKTFYEGLAALWFLREVTATMEAVGVSVLGHVDRLLIDLYRGDLEAGRITENEARDLLARWMLPTDVKFHVEDNEWPETSTCMELGGCDEDGRVVFNELTRLIIEVHKEHGLLNPKLNCRYNSESPSEYLDLVSSHILDGHNVFALLNDDVLIPACVRAGKSEREARLYVNGGCQETIVEGVEHSAGAYYYFNMPRVLDLCLLGPPEEHEKVVREEAARRVPKVIEHAEDFETFYRRFMESLRDTVAVGAEWRREAGSRWCECNPCPFFSAALAGCIESASDYTAGGAKYNPAGIAYVGLGTLVDSLYAIKTAVYDEKWITLSELRDVLAANWAGYASVRSKFLALPKFGHGHDEVDALGKRICKELAAHTRTLTNERGGRFQASFFVYYAFARMAKGVRATPDGREADEMFSQGIAPGRLRPPKSLTQAFRSLAEIDFTDFPGNAVLDVQLPVGGPLTAPVLSAVARAFARHRGPTLQFNCVSVEEMKDAQAHPERHRDLVVRISGLSAHFVALDREVQDEIIARTVMTA